MGPAITIGLPVRNGARTLVDTLRSVFAQTWSDWELLAVDDGSTDGSVDLLRAVTDSRIRVLVDGRHMGLISRLNQIAVAARAPLLARMDADDMMHPDRLALQRQALLEWPSLDVVGTPTYVIDDRGRVRGIRGTGPLDTSPYAVLRHGLFIHPTVTGRTVWFRTHRYDRRFVRAEDHELWVRTCTTGRFAKLDEPLYFYREQRVRLAAYLASCRSDRRMFRLRGPVMIGRLRTSRLVLGSALKSLTYCLLTPWGLDAHLVRFRSTVIAPTLRRRADTVLDAIRSTPVPGLTT